VSEPNGDDEGRNISSKSMISKGDLGALFDDRSMSPKSYGRGTFIYMYIYVYMYVCIYVYK
jgi:hypothetical protein